MRAIGARQYLPASDPLSLVEFETAKPMPGPLDLLVKISAVGVNPVDTKVRKLIGDGPLDAPKILGWDAAGTVEAVGPLVTDFSPGDEVFYAGDVTRPGSNAEYQLVDQRIAAKKPATFSFAQAAALPLVSITAWELLFERMGVDPDGKDAGKALLIINGAGGVGSAMIPLAKRAGLIAHATASRPETHEWCLKLGADHILNHREPLRPQAEEAGVTEYPFIANLFDTDGYWQITADLLAPLGALGLIVENQHPIQIGNPFRLKSPRIVWEYMFSRPKFQTPDMKRQGEILATIAALADAGRFPDLANRIFGRITPEALREAHAAMESGTAVGKWVLENF
ncbi:MAG: zinc-binding alcohol dehydrogenase family protein [Akkermansiaceae bacterium]|nr:zinc-binding alcohol dehydrogenase family protein [Akkermansiaceae bacterium]